MNVMCKLLMDLTKLFTIILQSTIIVILLTKHIIKYIYDRLISEKQSGTHKVEVSVLEIYNNDIRDLLSNDPNIKHDINTSADGSVSVPTLASK